MRAIAVYSDQGVPVASKAWATENTFERVQGWLKLGSAGTGEGLLISPCASLHTFGMRFDLDIAFVDRKGLVLKLVRGAKPGRLVWGPWRGLFFPWAVRALELPAGALAAAVVGEGQTLKFGPREGT